MVIIIGYHTKISELLQLDAYILGSRSRLCCNKKFMDLYL